MKRLLALVCAAALLICACTACGNTGSAGSYYVKIGDVELREMPRRVVTMSNAMTETVCALGFGTRLVGKSDDSYSPSLGRELTDCGTALVPDTDTLVSLEPDVVFSSVRLPSAATEALAAIGCSVIVLPYSDTLSGVYTVWEAVATVLGGAEWGERIAEQLRYAAEVIFADIKSNVTDGETAAFLLRLPSSAATGDTFLDEVLDTVGLQNAAADANDWVYPADDTAPAADILLCSDDITMAQLEASVWQSTTAVINDRVAFLDGSALECQSPRMIFVLQDALREAYPDVDWKTLDIIPDMEVPQSGPETLWEKLFGK